MRVNIGLCSIRNIFPRPAAANLKLGTLQRASTESAASGSFVARSGLLEKPAADGTCSTTTSAPSWSGGTISVNKNPDGTANANWQCYRYKTFETTVPLRNMIGRQA